MTFHTQNKQQLNHERKTKKCLNTIESACSKRKTSQETGLYDNGEKN